MLNKRTGLAAEPCTRELAQEMAAIPALAEAFKESSLCVDSRLDRPVHIRIGGTAGSCAEERGCFPAPTVREMLAWLLNSGKAQLGVSGTQLLMVIDRNILIGYDITNPDALARACIKAVS